MHLADVYIQSDFIYGDTNHAAIVTTVNLYEWDIFIR